jgi:hypothetical protein
MHQRGQNRDDDGAAPCLFSDAPLQSLFFRRASNSVFMPFGIDI